MTLWSTWTWGQKNHRGGYFLPKFLVKKNVISCNDVPFDQIVKLVKPIDMTNLTIGFVNNNNNNIDGFFY
jgi:hypothetical protein